MFRNPEDRCGRHPHGDGATRGFYRCHAVRKENNCLESLGRVFPGILAVNIMAMFISTAREEQSTLESMATPCSVKAYGR